MRWFLLSLLLCIEGVSSAAIIAVIDSGVDYKHEHLEDKMWLNEFEAPENGVDEDFNGFIDDVYGWNFFDSTNRAALSASAFATTSGPIPQGTEQ